jgi:transcriptional regulator with XRE-family HTH domain
MTGEDREGRAELPEDAETSVELFRALGKQIKLLRERAGLNQAELGRRIGYGMETVSSVERACRVPQPDFLEAADRVLDAGGLLKIAIEDVAKAKAKSRVRHPVWFRDFARLEAEAVEICDYSNQIVQSSHSDGEGGACVEVAAGPGAVRVRDSKDREGPQLAVAPAPWAAFVSHLAERA